MYATSLLSLVFFALQQESFCQDNEIVHDSAAERFLEELDKKSYNKKIRPNVHSDKPVNISIALYINTISDVNDANMDFSVDLVLHQMWHDPRLAFNSSSSDNSDTIILDDDSMIWHSFLYFRNEKEGKQQSITKPNVAVRISSRGNVLYSQRLALVLACHYDFSVFPMDNQTCKIQMENFAYPVDHVIFTWANNPILVSTQDTYLPEFELTGVNAKECKAVYPIGTYACLYATVEIQRDIRFFLLNIYVPSIVVVMLSFLSFWIDPNSTPARVAICVITVLTIVTQIVSLQSRLPRVSYVKAMDTWLCACLCFSMGSMLEYALVSVLLQKKILQPQERKKENSSKHKETHEVNYALNSMSSLDKQKQTVCCAAKRKLTAQHVDKVSKGLFPILFLIFNLLYWGAYMVFKIHPPHEDEK
ncbi:glycine receptor subunit alphaZ1-like [Lingula anatina]|uniref:Glycine receptor subunit alphaZ1-like n=1 Tax=Lingula anatina TaxID=7574 RepID=A0A1S3HAQ0_LINAN|nr:glycine receptor subunit alphaZ1-like [Lingula anatina]|eukprot:XP_013382536.1 glycine receptor subunit alphaZ1-like [Lingula anatina]